MTRLPRFRLPFVPTAGPRRSRRASASSASLVALAALLGTVSFAAASLAACGKIPAAAGGDAGPDGGGPDPCASTEQTPEVFFECAKGRQCQVFVACSSVFPDVDTCLAQFSDFADGFRRTTDALAAGRQTMDGEAAVACLAELDALIAAQQCDGELDACESVFKGLVAAGGVCFEQDDCAIESSFCAQADGNCDLQCCQGSCVSPSPIGGSCGGTVNCIVGAQCASMVGQPNVCVSGDVNSPCADDGGCDRELFCENGTCVGDRGEGGACRDDDECVRPMQCQGENNTTGVPGTCRLVDQVGKLCEGYCQGSDVELFCETTPGATLGTCREVPDTVGESCVQAGNCVYPLRCDAGICKQRPGPGESCTSYNCAPGSYCTSEITNDPAGTCNLPQADGRPCTSGDQCVSRICAGSGAARVCQAYAICE